MASKECEDGNSNDNDGCSSTCTLEDGFTCTDDPAFSSTNPTHLALDICVSTCGDGKRKGSEGCDDGNLVKGDGCDENCLVETNW